MIQFCIILFECRYGKPAVRLAGKPLRGSKPPFSRHRFICYSVLLSFGLLMESGVAPSKPKALGMVFLWLNTNLFGDVLRRKPQIGKGKSLDLIID
jgi:hypothetical protein